MKMIESYTPYPRIEEWDWQYYLLFNKVNFVNYWPKMTYWPEMTTIPSGFNSLCILLECSLVDSSEKHCLTLII